MDRTGVERQWRSGAYHTRGIAHPVQCPRSSNQEDDPMNRSFSLSIAVALTVAASFPAGALAQVNFEPRDVTRGVTVPGGGGVAGDFDATAVVHNPAGLATLRGVSMAFAATVLDDDDTEVGGGGWGLFLALPLRLFGLTYGFGFESVDSPTSWVSPGGLGQEDGSYLLNSIGLGGDVFSIGWTTGVFFWDDTPQRDTLTTHHVGLSLRPSRFLAAGVTLRDVFEPVGRVPEEKFVQSWDLEAMIRRLATGPSRSAAAPSSARTSASTFAVAPWFVRCPG